MKNKNDFPTRKNAIVNDLLREYDQIKMQDYYSDDDRIVKFNDKIKPPTMYKVLLKNDQVTPYDFIIEILRSFFGKDNAHAKKIVQLMDNQGEHICGVYSREIAETKSALVLDAARAFEYPLVCTFEPIDQTS